MLPSAAIATPETMPSAAFVAGPPSPSTQPPPHPVPATMVITPPSVSGRQAGPAPVDRLYHGRRAGAASSFLLRALRCLAAIQTSSDQLAEIADRFCLDKLAQEAVAHVRWLTPEPLQERDVS